MKAEKGGSKLQTKNQIRVVTNCKMCLFSMLYGKIGVTFVYNFALRKFDFREPWSATSKNRGRSKKTQGLTALKNGGSSLAVSSYLQRGSLPPRLSPAHGASNFREPLISPVKFEEMIHAYRDSHVTSLF